MWCTSTEYRSVDLDLYLQFLITFPAEVARVKIRSLLFLLILTVVVGQAEVITNGLIGYWAADNNANDSSPTANNGTFTGSYASGVVGSAFDLSTGVVHIPDVAAYSLGSAFTVGFWFNTNDLPAANVAFMGQDTGGGNLPKWIVEYGYSCGGQHNCMELHMNGPGGSVFLDSNAVTLPTGWNQFTLVRNGNTFSFYLNGQNIGNASSSYVFPDPTADLLLGEAEPAFNNFRGLMDDIVIYNRGLSATEVQQLAGVPEPSAAWLAGLALAVLAALRRKMA